MPESENYAKMAEDDAKEAAENFLDEIVDAIFDDGEAATGITDYSDSYHHESHVDKSYSLLEAATLLDQLDAFEETDSGLWEGQEPREAVITQAAFTYGNAVYHEFQELLEKVNDDLSGVMDDLNEKREAGKEHIEEEIGNIEDSLKELEEDSPWHAEGQKRIEELKEELEKVDDDDAFEERAKRRIRMNVEIALGIRRAPKPGTKEWMPGA